MSCIFYMDSWSKDRSGDSNALAAELSAKTHFPTISLLSAFGLALEAGADPVELDKLGEKWGGDYIKRLERLLGEGDLAGLNGILLMAVGIAAETKAALQSVVGDLAMTAGEAKWNPSDGDPPNEFTAEWVTATLTEAGYTWNGTAWVRS